MIYHLVVLASTYEMAETYIGETLENNLDSQTMFARLSNEPDALPVGTAKTLACWHFGLVAIGVSYHQMATFLECWSKLEPNVLFAWNVMQ